MKIPINSSEFEKFVEESRIFEKTHMLMGEYLKKWYEENPETFREDLWADLDTVLRFYGFEYESVAFNKSFSYDPPMDYFSCRIRIYDQEPLYCIEYTAFFDMNLNCINEKITK